MQDSQGLEVYIPIDMSNCVSLGPAEEVVTISESYRGVATISCSYCRAQPDAWLDHSNEQEMCEPAVC